MSLILQINTALEIAHVSIAREGNVLAQRQNETQNDHAAWLHIAIQEVLEESGIHLDQLNAVGVTAGPGSYTGLRVGMSAAKGICYAKNLPLIAVSSLQLLAAGVKDQAEGVIIPLIDARRDEVYAGYYDSNLNLIRPEQALILQPNCFNDLVEPNKKIILTGNGASKTLPIVDSKDFFLIESKHPEKNLALITYEKFYNRAFADLAYFEPVYLKEFYTTAKDR
jgi:tRNA threonylcarbamoyladenosine biosynthesis protein TsaB